MKKQEIPEWIEKIDSLLDSEKEVLKNGKKS